MVCNLAIGNYIIFIKIQVFIYLYVHKLIDLVRKEKSGK